MDHNHLYQPVVPLQKQVDNQGDELIWRRGWHVPTYRRDCHILIRRRGGGTIASERFV